MILKNFLTQHMKLIILVVCCFVSKNGNALTLFFGKCPDVKVVQNFNVAQYTGVWYEYSKYPTIFQKGGKCVFADYTSKPDGTINVLNVQYDKKNQKSSIEGSAKFADSTKTEAKLIVSFPSVPQPKGSNYWVLGTDYTNYAVVYSCTKILFMNTKYVWILTRNRQPTDAVIENAKTVLNSNGIDLSKLVQTEQNNCPV